MGEDYEEAASNERDYRVLHVFLDLPFTGNWSLG